MRFSSICALTVANWFVKAEAIHGWGNPERGLRSSVPRHTEIKDLLARKICKDPGIPKI